MTTKVSDPRLQYHRTRALSEIKNQSDKTGLRGMRNAGKSSRPKGQVLTKTYSSPPTAPYPPIPAAAPTSIDVTFSTESVVTAHGARPRFPLPRDDDPPSASDQSQTRGSGDEMPSDKLWVSWPQQRGWCRAGASEKAVIPPNSITGATAPSASSTGSGHEHHNKHPQSGVKVVPGGGQSQSWPQPPYLPQQSANGRISTHYSSNVHNVGSYSFSNPAGGKWNASTPPPPAPYPPLPRSAPRPVLVPCSPDDDQSARGSPSSGDHASPVAVSVDEQRSGFTPPPRTIQPRERDPRPVDEHWLPPLPPPPYWKQPPELGAAMRPAYRQGTEAPHGAHKSVTNDDKNGSRPHSRGHQPMNRQDHHYRRAEEKAPPQRSPRPPQGGASNLQPGPTGVCGAGRQATEAPRGTQNSVTNHDKNGSRSHTRGHQQMYRQYDHYRPAEEKAPPQRSPCPSQGGVSNRQPGLTKVCGAGRDFTRGNDAVHGARTSGIKMPRDQDEDKLAEITSKILALDLNPTTKSTVQEAPADVASKAYMSLEEYKAAEKAGDVVYKGKSTVDELYASGKAYNPGTRRWIKVENAKKKAVIAAAPALLANVALLENTVKLLSQRSQLLETKAEMLKEQSVRPTATLASPTAPKLIVFDTNCFMNSLCGIKCRVADIAAREADTSILIPKAVLAELDGLKKNDMLGFRAREATRYLMSLFQTLEGNEFPVVARFQGDMELYRDDGHHKAPENLRGDASILNCCMFFAQGIKTPRKVTLVTGDNNFRMQAKANRFGVEGNPQCLAEHCPRPFCPVKSRQQSLRGSFP